MNYLENHFAEILSCDTIKPTNQEIKPEEFNEAEEVKNLLSFVQRNPHSFMRMIKMAELILSVRDMMWQETEGNC